MTGWWQRARVVSALGTGALLLGGGPAVYAAGADDPSALPAEAAEADELNSWSRWVRAGGVIRFRVWLEGSGTDARLAVETTPAEALMGIECPQAIDPRLPRGGPQLCTLGEVNARRSVDVLLTMPDEAEDIELTAVARMRNREGVWVTHTARTTVENPASRSAEIVKAAQILDLADPVLPRPAPGVLPRPPGSPAEDAGTPGRAEDTAAEVGKAVPAVTGSSLAPSATTPGSATPHASAEPHGSATPHASATTTGPAEAPNALQIRPVPVAPLNPPALGAPRIVGEPGARAVPPDPHPRDRREGEGAPMILEDPETPQGSASVYEDPGAEEVAPEDSGAPESAGPSTGSSAGPSAGPSAGSAGLAGQGGGGASAGMGQGGGGPLEPITAGEPARPKGAPQARRSGREQVDVGARSAASLSEELAEAGQMPPLTGEVPQMAAPMPQPPGQIPPVWNDPNLRMPLAAPAPVVSPSSSVMADSQPLGAPLPQDFDGSSRQVRPIAESDPILTGMRGIPVVGVALGVLLGLLWLQMRVQRRRESRSVL
ncbi:hypothetical protein ABZV14_21330 [Streptosporangium canum]|uniref:hypothetical protein n=1 Tax=Streptosporangium canum TaxID=324952 RepID=UPI0033B9626A